MNEVATLLGTLVLVAVFDPPLVLATVAAVSVVVVLLAVLMPAIGTPRSNPMRRSPRSAERSRGR